MKRVMIMIAAAVLLLSTSSFALDVKGYVTAKALSAFAKDFSGATNVNWQEKENFYLVEFRVGETNCTAAYSEEGELIASTKVIKLKELSPAVTQLVKENYPGYEVGENVVALTCSGKVHYSFTVSNSKEIRYLKLDNDKQLSVEKTIAL
jgi:hypothetical protein